MARHTIIAVFCLLLFSCRSNSSSNALPGSTLIGRTLPSNSEILAKTYDINYQQPEYFYQDERTDTVQSYTVYHVKDSSSAYELCTNDFFQATEWETSSNDSLAVNGTFIESIENDRYFEFVRDQANTGGETNTGEPASPAFARVFKCDYVIRDGVDRNSRNGNAGTLNLPPLSSETIRVFTEYMWQFTFFWPTEKTVLESFSSETSAAYEHTLVLSFKTHQGTGQCDLVELVDWVFSLDKNNGQVSKEFNVLRTMEAKVVNGLPQMCTS